MTPPRERIVAGCMTGTSLDGLDAALVRIVGTGLDMTAQYLGWVSHDMPPELRETLMHLASGGAAEPLTYLRAARGVGELYADSVQRLLDETQGPRPEFVVAHGQTIWHAPKDDGGPKSWQLFDPWPVVKRIGVPVCYDLRQADLIAGGEGAPLTPLADWVMYREKADVVLNLGGIVNHTTLFDDDFEYLPACDIGPCNILLDGLNQRLLGTPYDEDGATAAKGKRVQPVLHAIGKAIRSKHREHGHPASLGRELYNTAWLDELAESIRPLASIEDILHTAVIHTAIDACTAVDEYDEADFGETRRHTVVLAGGGTKNRALVDQIRANLGSQDVDLKMDYDYDVLLSDDLGIPCEAREAMGFAVLGALSRDGVPCSLPQVTGAKDPGVAGVWAGVGQGD
ncbi:anhydro-N-acetylmuramic acid kinase [Phycisphaeraceae bacterium D3-23]